MQVFLVRETRMDVRKTVDMHQMIAVLGIVQRPMQDGQR